MQVNSLIGHLFVAASNPAGVFVLSLPALLVRDQLRNAFVPSTGLALPFAALFRLYPLAFAISYAGLYSCRPLFGCGGPLLLARCSHYPYVSCG